MFISETLLYIIRWKIMGISLFRSLNPLNDLKALVEAVKIIRKEKSDVIH